MKSTSIRLERFIAFFLTLFTLILWFKYPVCATSGNVFRKNRNCIKKVALTFDDGPHPVYTKKILDILNEYGVTATFFVIGENIRYYPEAMKEICKSGCEIGNHTFTHCNISKLSCQQINSEISKCEKAIIEVGGCKPTLFRPPEGVFNCTTVKSSATLNDYSIILWSIDTLDWAHTPPQRIAENVLGNLRDGDIILMHDYISGGSPTCDALKLIIPEILKRGYEFVTVDFLINS